MCEDKCNSITWVPYIEQINYLLLYYYYVIAVGNFLTRDSEAIHYADRQAILRK